MATEKLSQFTISTPIVSDYVSGATAGSPNKRFLLTSMVSGGAFSMPTPLGPSGGNLTIYCATTGSDSNTGLSPAQAVFTPQRGLDIALLYDYSAGDFTWTLNIANGDYTSQIHGGAINPAMNGTESENPLILGNGATTTTIGEVSMPSTQGNNFILISTIGVKSASSNASIWSFGNGAIIISGDIHVGTTRVDGHVDQLFYATGSAGAVLFDGGVNVTVDASITNTQSLATANFSSVEFSGPNLIFPGSFISSGSPNAILFSTFFGNVTWNSCSVTNGANFGGPGVQSGLDELNSNLSVDATMTLGNGFFGGLDNTSSVNNSLTNRFIQNPPTTSNLPNQTFSAFLDQTHRQRWFALNESGTIYANQFGHFVNTQTGASYTLALTDQEGVVEMNNAGANTLTIPTNATVNFPKGVMISIVQAGAGATTIAGAGGVTVHNAGALSGQWGTAKIFQRATDEWIQANGAL